MQVAMLQRFVTLLALCLALSAPSLQARHVLVRFDLRTHEWGRIKRSVLVL